MAVMDGEGGVAAADGKGKLNTGHITDYIIIQLELFFPLLFSIFFIFPEIFLSLVNIFQLFSYFFDYFSAFS